MDSFLKEKILDNTIQNLLIAGAVILVVLFVRKYLARPIASLIFPLIRKIWHDVDKKSFVNLVARPLGFFLAVLVTVVTLYKLKFPADWRMDLYRITVQELLHGFGSFIIIIAFIRLLLRIIDFLSLILRIRAERTEGTTDDQLVVFFKDFFKVIIVVMGLLMIIKFAFGFNISNLLTGLSLVGAAIALALRESLENLIASFIIFFDKPFSLGDSVKVHNFSGTVEKIGLRSTRIRTDQKTFITVPNKQMVDSILDNLSLRTQRKGELRLDIDLATPVSSLDQLVLGIRKLLERKEVESSTVLLSDITSSGFQVITEYFTGTITQKEFNSIKEQINFDILKLMESLKIEIAGAATDVKVSGTLSPHIQG